MALCPKQGAAANQKYGMISSYEDSSSVPGDLFSNAQEVLAWITGWRFGGYVGSIRIWRKLAASCSESDMGQRGCMLMRREMGRAETAPDLG